MRKILHLFLMAYLLQGLIACGQHKYNPDAIKLNDSAVALIMDHPVVSNKGDSSTIAKLAKNSKAEIAKIPGDTTWHDMYNDTALYEKAIGLLDKAIQIDSNYFIAYLNKCNFQTHLKRFNDALLTGKEMIRLMPNDTTIKYLVGKIYYKTGDTVQAKIYYQDYLTYCNHRLAAMSVTNNQYKFMELRKAFLLIVLNQAGKGHDILEKLYREANDIEKDEYDLYRHVTKADLIAGKELTKTVGNSSTSFSLDF